LHKKLLNRTNLTDMYGTPCSDIPTASSGRRVLNLKSASRS